MVAPLLMAASQQRSCGALALGAATTGPPPWHVPVLSDLPHPAALNKHVCVCVRARLVNNLGFPSAPDLSPGLWT